MLYKLIARLSNPCNYLVEVGLSSLGNQQVFFGHRDRLKTLNQHKASTF
jgi:hypothetical protein